jgi:hypothetical protein
MNLRPTTPANVDDLDTASLVLAAREHVEVTVPRTAIQARMRLVSRAEALAIKADAWRAFQELAIANPANGLTVADWNMEIAVRHLAVAVRAAVDDSRALASLDDWRACDDDQIASLWDRYQDHRDRLDPLGADSSPLTEAEFTELEAAAKKKAVEVLTSYGSRKLARFVTILAERPAS